MTNKEKYLALKKQSLKFSGWISDGQAIQNAFEAIGGWSIYDDGGIEDQLRDILEFQREALKEYALKALEENDDFR